MATAGPVVEMVAYEQLQADLANPRRISDAELDSLTRSITQFGFVQPVIARREDATVIGGHQRLVAARRLGLERIPVIWLDITAEQAKLLGLALNKISGDWDDQLLARLLADLQGEVDLTLSGFDDGELKDLFRSLEARERRLPHVPPTARWSYPNTRQQGHTTRRCCSAQRGAGWTASRATRAWRRCCVHAPKACSRCRSVARCPTWTPPPIWCGSSYQPPSSRRSRCSTRALTERR
jgi:hypothetical protein